MRSRALSITALAGLALVAAGCGGSGSTPNTPSPTPGGNSNITTVTIPSSDGYGNSSFSPGNVTVGVGATVVWANRDTVTHTTVGDNNQWNGTMNANTEFSRTFSAAGSFNYRCTLHPGMSGTVTVQTQ